MDCLASQTKEKTRGINIIKELIHNKPVFYRKVPIYTDPAVNRQAITGKNIITLAIYFIAISLYIQRLLLEYSDASFDENPNRSRSLNIIVYMGALEHEKLIKGEWWRLLTATCLHSSFTHLLFNLIFWKQIGELVEPDWGLFRFALVLVLSGVSGNLLSSVLDPYSISLGASGAIYGIVGSLIPYIFEYWNTIPNVKAILFYVSLASLVSLFLGFMPRVDNYAHIGGFVGGVICGFMTVSRFDFTNDSRYFNVNEKEGAYALKRQKLAIKSHFANIDEKYTHIKICGNKSYDEEIWAAYYKSHSNDDSSIRLFSATDSACILAMNNSQNRKNLKEKPSIRKVAYMEKTRNTMKEKYSHSLVKYSYKIPLNVDMENNQIIDPKGSEFPYPQENGDINSTKHSRFVQLHPSIRQNNNNQIHPTAVDKSSKNGARKNDFNGSNTDSLVGVTGGHVISTSARPKTEERHSERQYCGSKHDSIYSSISHRLNEISNLNGKMQKHRKGKNDMQNDQDVSTNVIDNSEVTILNIEEDPQFDNLERKQVFGWQRSKGLSSARNKCESLIKLIIRSQRFTIRSTADPLDKYGRTADFSVWVVRITGLFALATYWTPLIYLLFGCPNCFVGPGQIILIGR